MLLTLVLLMPVFAQPPEAVMAAIVIDAVRRLVDVKELARCVLLRSGAFPYLVAAAGVLAVGVLPAMLIAVMVLIVLLLRTLSRPAVSELGRVGETHVFAPLGSERGVAAVPDLTILRPEGQLLLANVDRVRSSSGSWSSTVAMDVLPVPLTGARIPGVVGHAHGPCQSTVPGARKTGKRGGDLWLTGGTRPPFSPADERRRRARDCAPGEWPCASRLTRAVEHDRGAEIGLPDVSRGIGLQVADRSVPSRAPAKEGRDRTQDDPPAARRALATVRSLLRGVEEFRRTHRAAYALKVARLARVQTPDTLAIACSDSRISPLEFAPTEQGDVLVVRDVGNLVPRSSIAGGPDTAFVGAAVEYALSRLQVTDIVVCGHSECGAMRAIGEGTSPPGAPHLAAWLEYGRRPIASLPPVPPGLMPYDHLSQQSLLWQLDNLRSYDVVSDAERAGHVVLHGWWFDIARAEVLDYDSDLRRFVLLDEVRLERLIAERSRDDPARAG